MVEFQQEGSEIDELFYPFGKHACSFIGEPVYLCIIYFHLHIYENILTDDTTEACLQSHIWSNHTVIIKSSLDEKSEEETSLNDTHSKSVPFV